ncbi:unnamed protein product, partial [Closterium sp. NIES-54]
MHPCMPTCVSSSDKSLPSVPLLNPHHNPPHPLIPPLPPHLLLLPFRLLTSLLLCLPSPQPPPLPVQSPSPSFKGQRMPPFSGWPCHGNPSVPKQPPTPAPHLSPPASSLPPTSSPASAIAKPQLQRPENATILRFIVPFTNALTSPSYTIYPQKVAADGDYDYRHGGTMYFGWTGVNPNRGAPNETVLVANFTTVGAFAITGTSALGTPEAERL